MKRWRDEQRDEEVDENEKRDEELRYMKKDEKVR